MNVLVTFWLSESARVCAFHLFFAKIPLGIWVPCGIVTSVIRKRQFLVLQDLNTFEKQTNYRIFHIKSSHI